MGSVAVLGPGGVGGFLAAALSRGGEDVIVVAREETAEIIDRTGISVQSERLGTFASHPRAVAHLQEPVPLLFVAAKATGLDAALERIETPPQLIVPLLNGIEHLPRLRRRFGAGIVAAGTIRIESDRPQPGRIVQTSPFLNVELAGARRDQLQEVVERLERSQVPACIGSSESHILWAKLVRLVALALTTSAADRPLGFLREDPGWRQALIDVIEEAAAAAGAEGARIDPAATLGELQAAHPELGSSMQRDIAAGREPELDAIAGAVLRAGARHGLSSPTIVRLAEMVAERAGIEPPRVG